MVVGIGEALWDVLPEGKKLGGAPANFAYHVSQFGLQSTVVSAVGDDDLGREIEKQFEEKKLNFILKKVPFPTGTVQVELDDKGIPQYDICESVAWDNIPFSAELESLAKKTRAVCFGSLAQRNAVSRTTIAKFLEAMPDTDETLRIFDINLRQSFYNQQTITDSIKACNILKINDEELDIVSKMFGYEGNQEDVCLTILKQYGLKMLILTCGTDGSYVFADGKMCSYIPTPKVNVADTVGAGDSFTGTFVSQILLGKSISEAHTKAVEVSAFVCTQNGAMPVYSDLLKR